MDDKSRQDKKPMHYKVHIIMNVILLVLFIIIVISIIIFYTSSDDSDDGVFPDPNYRFEIIDNSRVVLYNSGIRLNEFECNDFCDIYTENNKGYFYNGRILLQDGDVFFLFDLLNERKKSAEFKGVEFILDNKGNIRLFKVTDGNRYGIMNLTGNMQVDLLYDDLGHTGEDGYLTNYSFERSYITALRGNQWGKISLENGRGIIDFQYEDIVISNYSMLAVKEDGLWYLVDEGNIRILTEGFDAIQIHENFIVVAIDNEAFIINVDGEVISNKIALHLPISPWLFNRPNNGLFSRMEESELHIYIGQRIENEFIQTRFIYDLETKEIVSL